MILLDGNNIWHRTYHRVATQPDPTSLMEALAHEFVAIIEHIMNSLPAQGMILAFDHGRSRRRMEIYPEYKATRSIDPANAVKSEIFTSLRPILSRLIASTGTPVICVPGEEGDDIIAALTLLTESSTIVSTDTDFYQLLSHRAAIFNPMTQQHITDQSFYNEWQILPDEYLNYKAIVGDKSDNITGVPGWGVAGTKQIFQRFGSWSNILSELTPRSKKEAALFSAAAADIIARNQDLIALTPQPDELIHIIMKTLNYISKLTFPDDLIPAVANENGIYTATPALRSIKTTNQFQTEWNARAVF